MKCKICSSNVYFFMEDLYDDRYGAIGRHSILRCLKCGFGMTVPGLKKREIGKFYAEHYPLADYSVKEVNTAAHSPNRWLGWVKGIDNMCHWYIHPGLKVLDIGSGTCTSLLEIKLLGGIPYGIEPDPNAQRLARELAIPVHQGFISDNPFPTIKFDFITASQVIEHDPNPITFLSDAKRHLSPGGEVILSFPNIDSFYQKIFRRKWLNWHIPYHLNFFTLKAIQIAAGKTGFKVKKIRTITPNLWTVLQLQMFFSQPSEGIPNPIWTKKKEISERGRYYSVRYIFLKLFFQIAIFLLSVLNRGIDSVGSGDSYLVFLTRKNDK